MENYWYVFNTEICLYNLKNKMFISLWKQTHYGHFIISDLQITSSKLNTGFPFIKRTETTAFKPQLRGFLPFKKKTFPRTTYKSVMQHIFKCCLNSIWKQYISTLSQLPTIQSTQEKAGKKKGPTSCQVAPHFTLCQTKQRIQPSYI